MPALTLKLRIGLSDASTSTPCEITPALTWPGAHAPVVALVSRSAPPRSVLQPLMFCTRKTEPLKVLSWKFLNAWWNAATLMLKVGDEYFAPISNALLISCANCRLPTSDCAPPAAANVVVGTPPTTKIGAINADRSRLKPHAL